MRSCISFITFIFIISFILMLNNQTVNNGYAAEARLDTVKTDRGYISGTVVAEVGNEVHIYRGIPYASPPVGDLRWKAPRPAASWQGIRECVDFKASPPQEGGPMMDMEQSEDCLYLNVITPAKEASEKLPVMVWFHGGGLSFCTANDPLFNGSRLPQKGVIVVSVSHRLGTLGLMVHPLLSRESGKGISGNYIFLDLVESLKWVKRNIASFGGDPDNVTIFGESGGGFKVTAMLASPLAKGLFHRAIIESGSGFMGTPQKELEDRGRKLFARLGIATLAEARALSYDKLIKAALALGEEMKMPIGLWDPAIDGWFLKDNAINLFKTGNFNSVPVIAGANLGELPTMGKMLNFMPYYSNLINANTRAGAKGYIYIFDQVPAGWKAQNGVSVHSLELFYVFGDYDYYTRPSWPLAQSLQPKSVTSANPGLNSADKKVSNEMMEMWVQFAKTGNPSIKGLIKWPEYNSDSDQYLFIADPLTIKTGFSKLGN